MSVPTRRSAIAILALLTCGACSFPFDSSARDGREGLTIRLSAAPVTVAPGDTVRFRAVAHNATAQRIQVGVQCGPSMDVRLTTPGGQAVSVLHTMIGPNGAFTCELGPHHFAPPRDSLVNQLVWRAPDQRGTYRAVAGARGSSGLQDLSAEITIIVR